MFDNFGKKSAEEDPLNESRLDRIDLQTLAKFDDNDEELLQTQEDIRRSAVRRNIQVIRQSSIANAPTSKKKQIELEVFRREVELWDDTTGEFRKAQDQLRKSGVSTKAGMLQILNKKLTEKITFRRKSTHDVPTTQEYLNQRVNKRISKRRSTMLELSSFSL